LALRLGEVPGEIRIVPFDEGEELPRGDATVPKGMVGVPLRGAASIDYCLMGRKDFRSQGTEALRALVVETVRA
jgi:hypothetical protein